MMEPSHEYLDDAVSRLARAWSRRSQAERSAFADRLAAVSASPGRPDGTLRTVRERAALCGAVTPSDLVRGLDREEASRALDLLAPEFDRVHTAGRWTWTLRTAPRRGALATLVKEGRLADRLTEIAEIGTDRAGELLRQLAKTWSSPRNKEGSRAGAVPDGDPATVAQALTWARPLGGLDGDLAEAQRRAAVRLLGESYGRLTRHGVFGRDRELARLREFAHGTGPSGEQVLGPSPVSLLPLTGIGGVGKSTVLGAFIKPFLDRIEAGDPTVLAVVVLDFDRVHFRPTAELELSSELTRQLGYAAPVAAADFSVLRYQLRDEQRQSGSDRHVGTVRSDSAKREASAFESEAGKLVRLHGLQHRPVLLVLDTFEEWQRERLYPDLDPMPWNSPERLILDWIDRIHFTMDLRNLRVIVSGRASLDFGRPGVHPQLVVGDLDPQSARDLLCALGVAAPDAAKTTDFAGGNPLTLHVAARFYRGLDAEARRDFLAGDPLAADELTAGIRTAVLYQRFLAHIPDEQVRKLAHPGLLLRRVTAELVRNVLARPCGLGAITELQARELTRRLADEVWLVQKTEDGLYHRRDVRGPMLRLMADDPAYLNVAQQIHAAAVNWYETNGNGRDPLPRGEARVEAAYHALMLKTGEEPVAPDDDQDRERWLQLTQELGKAVDEFPPKVAAQVHVLRGDQIRDRDAASLPDPVWRLWIERHGKALVDNNESTAALDLLDTRQSSILPGWLGQACSDTGQWNRYWPTVRRLSGRGQADSFFLSDRYALLNALLSQNGSDLNSYEGALSAYFSRMLEGADLSLSEIAERLFCSLLLDLGTPAGWPEAARWLSSAAYETIHIPALTESEQSSVDRFPVDLLRRMMTWTATSSKDPKFAIENVASFYRPDPRWMRDFAAFVGASNPADLDSYLARFDRAVVGVMPGASTHELLGEWSISYTRALGPSPIQLHRRQTHRAADLTLVLRGDNPELRPAIQLALAGLVTDVGLRELAAIAEPLLPVPASDLRPAALTDTSGGDRRTLIQLVEYVDRSGVMRDFLAEARRLWSEAELLQRVADAFTLWDDMNNRLLGALAARLRDEHTSSSPD